MQLFFNLYFKRRFPDNFVAIDAELYGYQHWHGQCNGLLDKKCFNFSFA